ncbi:MAG: transglycosylase SLT domain-containing protein, partial [Pseudomonadota bacterium]
MAKLTRARPICALIETSDERHGLPPSYFARLIWRESRFDARALSPKGAQGIAQFMPGTAKMVGLADPWDP